MDTLNLIAVAVIAAASLLAILHPAFDDNLMQRIGLAALCFGAVLRLWIALDSGNDLPAPRSVMLYGVAIYAIGTLWNYWYWHNRERDRRVPRDCPFWERYK